MQRKTLTFSSLIVALGLCCFSSHGALVDTASYQLMEQKITHKEYKKITSVLVNHQGKRIYEQYFNEGAKEYKNNVRSASKSITAILFGIAIEQGLFDSEHDKVLESFQDQYPIAHLTEKKRNMTFQDLLMMNPPMECNDWNELSQGNEERMYLLEDWERFALDLPNRGVPPWEPKAKDRPFGVAYSYCTAGVFLIGSAIARKAGVGLDTFAQKYLFEPLNIQKVNWPYSPLGVAQGGGGLEIRSEDLIKIAELLLNNGSFNGNDLVNQQWVDSMLQERSLAMPERNIKYGYLWWVFEFEHQGKPVKAYAAAGNGGNYLWMVPQLQLTAVITSTAFNTPYMHQQSWDIFENTILKSIR